MHGNNGKECFLFPLEYMYLTQGEYEYTYSHDGTYAMDFQGYGANGRVYNCPYYAPFSCHCVAIWGSTSPMIVWESDDVVNFIDGSVDYACIGFVHDDNTLSFHVGDTRTQGQTIGHTGTYGVGTGDHVHIEIKKGHYDGYYQNSHGIWQLRDPYHLYNGMGVNDTVLSHDYYINHNNVRVNYNWREFSISPTPPKKHKFPWFIVNSKKLHRM